MDNNVQSNPPAGTITNIVLKVDYPNLDELRMDYLTELGRGGIFIRTNARFPIESKISFSLSFPGLLEPIQLEGAVRFHRESTGNETGGMGVEIVDSDPASRQALDELIDRFEGRGSQDTNDTGQEGSFRVLLVEDNEFAEQLFEHAVRRFHKQSSGGRELEILHARDGLEAIQQLQGGAIDLAIVDHFLPVMTGTEIVRRMRADPKLASIPVLMLSVAGPEIQKEALEAGADFFGEKPILLRQLLNTLGRLLGRVQDSRESRA